MNKILNKFDNNYIKYFHFVPFIFSDIGRDFNQKYSLKKWLNIEDNTSYKDIKLANAFLGNWKNFKIDDIRLNTKYTMNNKFNFCFILIIQILPYIYQKYFKIGIKVNFNYFSHSYGNYPNFNIIGKFIKLNYRPNEIPNNFEHSELFDLCKIYHDYCGKQLDTDESFKFYSFQKDFKLAKKYMELFFKFDEKIINKKNKYINSMKNKKNLGIYYGGTNKLNPINFDTFLSYVDNELLKNKYDNIVISTDKIEYQEKFIAYYADFSIIILNKNLKDYENKGINSERLKIISNIVKNLKNSETFDEKMFYELELKRQSAINTIYLQNYIIENFLLSECDFVIKDNPDELSLCKIINPELNINLIRKYKNIPWPDSYIDLYSKYKSNKKINLVSLE